MFWRKMFLFMAVEIIVDGFIVCYTFPNVLFHFLKDVILIMTFLFYAMQMPFKDRLNELGYSLGIGVTTVMAGLFILGVAQMFNPVSPGLLRGLLGIKLMYLPWLVLPLAFSYVNHYEDIEKFAKTIAFTSIPVNLFGLIQYYKGPEFMVSTFGRGFIPTVAVAMVPGVSYQDTFVRVIGTFASSSLYGQFLVANIMLCFGLFFARSRPRLLWLPALFLSFLALLSTGSRGGFTTMIIMFLIFAVLLKKGRPLITAFLIFGLGLYAAFSSMSPVVAKRFATTLDTHYFRERTYGTSKQMFAELLEKYPMGKGIGAASQASRYLGKQQGDFSLIENYASKLQIELGIIGVILFYLLGAALFFRWRRWLREYNYLDPNLKIFATVFSAYVLGVFVAGFFPESVGVYIFLWSMIGFMARLPSLESSETSELTQSSE